MNQAELKYYLESLKTLIPQLDLNKPFHCTQAANYWIRTVILRKPFIRDRDSEFINQPTLEQIDSSVEFAIEACAQLEKVNPDLNQKLEKSLNVMPVNFKAKTNLDALTHVIAHTAEHYGELFQTTRRLWT